MIPKREQFEHPTRKQPTGRWVIPDRHGCQQEAEALEREYAEAPEREARERQRDYQERVRHAGLIGWLSEATFDTFTVRNDWADSAMVVDKAKGYTTTLLSGAVEKPWLILHGQFGTGKSHLAASVLHQAIKAGWNRCYFRVWTDYLRRLQASWKRNRDDDSEAETESDIVAELQDGRLVVIDDLDKRKPTEWSREILFIVLNHRYNAKLPTILTFNYGPASVDRQAPGRLALEEYLGRAVLDRLIGSAFDVVEFNGRSFRSGVKWQ